MARPVPARGAVTALLERRGAGWALAIALAIWLPFTALFHDIDYDEGQYIAAVALMRTGLPFRDFLYLQMPMHPLLLAPLAWLGVGNLFITLRLANAAMVGATLLIVHRTILAQGGGRTQAWLAVALMALCEPILFIASVARNDGTPMLLEAIAIMFLLRHWRAPGAQWSFAAAGLFMGLAIATKAQFALVGAAAGLVMLVQHRRLGFPTIALFVAGGVVGCLPILLFWGLAPGAFLFGVLEYPATAPFQWYNLGDRNIIFSPHVVALRLFRFTALGPTLIVLGLIVRSRLKARSQDEMVALLDVLIVAGLIAGILPQPIFRQYLAPLYPVLFIRFGLTSWWWPRRWIWRAALLVSVFGALSEAAWVEGGNVLPNALRAAAPPIDATRDARWIAQVVPPGSRVAGLAPERYLDSGLVFDPRFATGPFIFRTEGLVTPDQAAQWQVVPRAQMDAIFAHAPPDVLVAGGHRTNDVAAPDGLDVHVERWARSQGWQERISPSGALTIYLRPGLR